MTNIYSTDSCTNWTWTIQDWSCLEWTTVQSLSSQDVKNLGVEIGWVIAVFTIVLLFIVFLLQWILYAIMPKRWSRKSSRS